MSDLKTLDGEYATLPRQTASARRGWPSDRARVVLLPVATLIAVILLWAGATAVLDIPAYLVPSPQSVLAKLADHWLYLMQQLAVTLGETLLGVFFAIAIGVPLAMAIAYFKTLEQMIYPILIGVNSMPKVAIAPILVVWLGFGWTPKVVMVVLLSFFPIVLSTVSGLRSTPHELVDLARSLSATALQEFVKIRFRWALPQIFVGLKNGITLAVIGAVIAEFVGASSGLGFVIVQSGASADTALAFAAMTLLAVMSIALFYLLVALEKWLLPWAEENRA
jgi:NitT/TauT family transport system permease protein